MGWFSPSMKTKVRRFERNMPKRVTNLVAKWYDDNFEVGGWRRANTVSKWKRYNNYPNPVMNKTGALRASQRVKYGRNSISVEYTARYAKYHNDKTGTWKVNDHSNKDIIQRKIVDHSPTLVKEVKKFIMQEYKKIMR